MNIVIISQDKNHAAEMARAIDRYIRYRTSVKSFYSAREAVEYVKNNETDIIITEIVMKEMNGLEVITDITAYDQGIPILAISGQEMMIGKFDYLPVAKLLGATATLEKPFRATHFADVVLKLTVQKPELLAV